MTEYLLTMYQPDGPPPPAPELARIMADIQVVNAEMEAAGAWLFAAGLHEASTSTVVRAADGEVLLTDGPFTEGKEHVGGFTIIRADDLDSALGWAGKLSAASTLPIEVRPIQGIMRS